MGKRERQGPSRSEESRERVLYTLGYASWTLEQVAALVTAREGLLVDVRLKPYSSKPGFHHGALRQRLGPAYVHLPGFGNRNFRGGPVALQDPATALRQLKEQLGAARSAAPIFMCGCKDWRRCHRRLVAERVAAELGGRIEHLEPPRSPTAPGLFD